MPSAISAHARRRIKQILWARTREHRCWVCRRPLSFATATIDHFIPQSQGGKHHSSNARLACAACNAERGSEDAVAFRKRKRKELGINSRRLDKELGRA